MSRAGVYNYSRGAPYSYNDWLRDIRVELDIPPGGSEAYLRDKAKYDKIRTKKASKKVNKNVKCPPGYKYRPKRKPGQRKCIKEKVRIYLSFLQKIARRNKISIFKMRKDKRGYTRTLLTIPQLKSRLTRHGISYKMNNKFGIVPLMALSLASTLASNPMARSMAKSVATRAIGLGSNIANREYEKAKKKANEYIGTQFGVLQPTRSTSDSRNVRRDTEDALREMWNQRRNRVRELMRRQIAGDIIWPDRPWHRAAPPYATTIQRYARGMIARNPTSQDAGAAFGVLPMGGGKGPEEPEDPRIAAYAIEKKRKIAEQNRKWRAAKAAETADKYEAIREAGMDRAAADAIRFMGMTPREKATEQARQRRKLAKQAQAYMAQQAAAQALLASASGAGPSSSGAGPSTAGLDFTIPDVDFGRKRYYNYGTQEMWQ